jgi:Uma2 family endonuclease
MGARTDGGVGMPCELARRQMERIGMAAFHAFRDARPSREAWELIDGHPVRKLLPSIVHQRIAGNLERSLNERLTATHREWAADRNISVLMPGDDKFNPEPDVTVIDRHVEMGQLYAESFYFVAEVVSAVDQDWVLNNKLDCYQRHEHCHSVLYVQQDRVAADLYRRIDGWKKVELTNPIEHLDIAGVGDIGPLAGLYRHTPLALPVK